MFKVSRKNHITIISPYTTLPSISILGQSNGQPTIEKSPEPIQEESVNMDTVNTDDKIYSEVVDQVNKQQQLLHDSMIDLTTKNQLIFSDVDGELIVPHGVKKVFLTLCAGGGRGSKCDVKDKLYCSGSGGGGGEGFSKIPLNIESQDMEIKIKYRVGTGGITGDGGDTVFSIFVNGSYHSSITAHGGKMGTPEDGGQGCSKYVLKDGWGKKGKIFSAANNLPNVVHHGGNGGCSPFYHGGKGFSHSMQDRSECNGKWGGGGGGGVDEHFYEGYGLGGDGFVLIELEKSQ